MWWVLIGVPSRVPALPSDVLYAPLRVVASLFVCVVLSAHPADGDIGVLFQ